MSSSMLVNAAGAELDASRIEQLRTACRGVMIRPGDAEYDSARRIWNASIDKRPGLIVRYLGLADVISAVRR